MSLARVHTFALIGVEARRVWVEADIRLGLPAFTVVGLADMAVRDGYPAPEMRVLHRP